MGAIKNLKGFLIDIDGTLTVGTSPIEGAVESINQLRRRFPVCFLSNTTSKSPTHIYEQLSNLGFEIKQEEIFTVLGVIQSFLKGKKGGAYLLLSEKAKQELKDIPDSPVNYVVVAHAHENFTYANINQAFRYLMDGAELLSVSHTRYYQDVDNKLSLDGGAFTVALEFASGKKATLLGKPDPSYFLSVIKTMGLKPEEVGMIGDDIISDVKGAIDTGLTGILIKTGKFKASDLQKWITPDYTFNNLKDLIRALEI